MQTIPIFEIKINTDRRPVDDNKVNELANSIKEIGLLNPISISLDKKLIAGLHRVKAFQLLGKTEIPCQILNFSNSLHEELAEIDENLIRNELYFTDRGDQLSRRKEIYETLYPETKKETFKGNRYTGSLVSAESAPAKTSFVEDTAKKTGVSKRKIQEEIQLSKNLIPEAKQILKEKDMPKTEALQLARKKPEEQKQIVEKIASGEVKNIQEASRAILKDKVIQQPSLPTGKYRILYADPPWKYSNSMPDYATEQGDHYPLMTIEELCKLPIKAMAEENSVLFLWVTSPILEESFKVISAWGFKYKASFVWDKIKHNMGHYNSVRHEFLLVCVRGSCMPDERKLFDSVQSIERTEHSRKPEEFRKIIDTIYPHGKRVELFARKQVDGWSNFSNEVGVNAGTLSR